MSASNPLWKFKTEDLRVETLGQWTRGCIIADRRGRPIKEGTGDLDVPVVGDDGGWRDTRKGNQVQWNVQSPGIDKFAGVLLESVFGAI
jgi:hypothetical protein